MAEIYRVTLAVEVLIEFKVTGADEGDEATNVAIERFDNLRGATKYRRLRFGDPDVYLVEEVKKETT